MLYRLQDTGPDLSIVRRYRPFLPSRKANPVWSQQGGVLMRHRVGFFYGGSRPLPDVPPPDWEDVADSLVWGGPFTGSSLADVQNGRSIRLEVEHAGRMRPYQLVWTKRTQNITSPLNIDDTLVTTDFLDVAKVEIELTSTTGKRTLMMLGGSFSQINYYE